MYEDKNEVSIKFINGVDETTITVDKDATLVTVSVRDQFNVAFSSHVRDLQRIVDMLNYVIKCTHDKST